MFFPPVINLGNRQYIGIVQIWTKLLHGQSQHQQEKYFLVSSIVIFDIGLHVMTFPSTGGQLFLVKVIFSKIALALESC
jgi:hypothetical protein